MRVKIELKVKIVYISEWGYLDLNLPPLRGGDTDTPHDAVRPQSFGDTYDAE